MSSDPKVEEIRTAHAMLLAVGFPDENTGYLLTKLDEAEKQCQDAAEGILGMARVVQDHKRCLAVVEERDRVLLAGVKEALVAIQRDVDQLANLDAAELKAILSRLLPSTPTEEGNDDE